jgi:hypothetical protein
MSPSDTSELWGFHINDQVERSIMESAKKIEVPKVKTRTIQWDMFEAP